ncbi:MAG: peptidyl-prolyl cis-trans isomerase [Candidatus Eisenbacteria bacterium]|nr:peptidyl-prolyl cis-trans isomerase [Candidatus Eisenbacteria bacterium]
MRNVRSAVALLVMSLVTLTVCTSLAQAPASSGPALATVGTRRIERSEYEARLSAVQQQIAQRQGQRPAEFNDLLRRQMLETMIRLQLLTLEAKRTNVTVSTLEAEEALKKDGFFSPGGRFDAERWRLTRMSQPGRFQSALAAMNDQLIARKLNQQLEARFSPTEAALRTKAMRQLRRAVTEDLSLRASDFKGTYPEPRELSLLRYYQDHKDEFRRPDRATLSVVFVNDPPMTEAERQDPARVAAWNQRMRRAADSLYAQVRAGATLEESSVRFGGPRHDVTVLPDNFPGYWKGDGAASASVFKTEAGALLKEPVQGTEGWLVVRVDQVEPAHVAPFAQVAKEVRSKLREDSRLHHDERDRLALYAQLRDSLSGPAWTFRWAAVDTATVRVPEPTAADLDRWYRGHLADFSSFDAKSGSIVAKPLSEVREDVRLRWRRDTRVMLARTQADDLFQAWSAGKRVGSLESALRVKESAPAPMGADIDTGFAAAAISDSVWRRGEPRGAGLAPYARGFLVWQVASKIASHTPAFEQVEPALRTALDARNRAVEEAGARRLFDAEPKRFGGGKNIHFTRLVVTGPPLLDIKLTRAQVERWHRRNIDKYSAEELVRAKHILISPIAQTQAADRAARVRADSLLARIRAGESFDALAARYSEDPATKDKGGDLGVFRRGSMLPAFEDAAFAMQAGELAGPVRTDVGYHIIECTEHVPAYVQPLALVYTIVASDLAKAEADTIAMLRADSLARVVRTAAQGRAFAKRYGFEAYDFVYSPDQPNTNPQLDPYFDQLQKLKAGEVMPTKWVAKGAGYWITWVDSITSTGAPSWEQARVKALEAYRLGGGERALAAKVAELDSLEKQGWSFDSLAVLWGGTNRSRELAAAGTSTRGSIPEALDSLVFGNSERPAALQPGQLSGWVRWPGGIARVRLVERNEPAADRVAARMDDLRKTAVERRMVGYFDDLKRRYPVRINDRSLEAIPLPEPPDEE